MLDEVPEISERRQADFKNEVELMWKSLRDPLNLACGHDHQAFAASWSAASKAGTCPQRGARFRQLALTLIQLQTFQACEMRGKGITDGAQRAYGNVATAVIKYGTEIENIAEVVACDNISGKVQAGLYLAPP